MKFSCEKTFAPNEAKSGGVGEGGIYVDLKANHDRFERVRVPFFHLISHPSSHQENIY